MLVVRLECDDARGEQYDADLGTLRIWNTGESTDARIGHYEYELQSDNATYAGGVRDWDREADAWELVRYVLDEISL